MSVAVIGCQPPPPQVAQQDRATLEGQVRSMVESYTAAINQNDHTRFLSFISDDMLLVTPTQDMIRGRQAVSAATAPLFEQFVMNESIDLHELHIDGDWAAGRVSYILESTPKTGGASSTERGNAIVSMRRNAAGVWQWSQWIAEPSDSGQADVDNR